MRTGILAALLAVLGVSLCLNVSLGWKLRTRSARPRAGIEVGMRLAALPILRESGARDELKFDSKRSTIAYVFSPACGLCKRNLPNIRALAAQTAQRYSLIGLSSTTTNLQGYQESANLDFPAYALDLPRLPKGFNASVTPQTALVRSDGLVMKVWEGAYTGKDKKEIEAGFHVKLPGIAGMPKQR